MIRMPTRGLRWLAPLLFAGLVAGCDDDTITPIAPDRVSVTETFGGILLPNDAETFPFTSSFGTVTATLLNLSPDNTIMLGLSLGTWNGLSCAVVLANDKATQGITLTGTVNSTGNLCMRVYDIGALSEALNYEVRVVHF